MGVVAVFGSSTAAPGDGVYEAAEHLGGLLATNGHTLVTGGYGGVMEASSAGAARRGGRVVGVVAPTVFPGRPGANRWVGEVIEATSITERVHRIVSMAQAFVAFPGSVGTATELLMAVNVGHVASESGRPPPLVLIVGDHWADLVDLLERRYAATPGQVTRVDDAEAAADLVMAHLEPPAAGR